MGLSSENGGLCRTFFVSKLLLFDVGGLVYVPFYSCPAIFTMEKGSLDVLKTIKGKKAVVVVGGGSMKRFGFLDKAVGYLKEAGMEVQLFENVEPDPSVETVMRGAEAMREFQPDWIISMGGGSPIDAAKAMWVFYEYPDTTFEEIIQPFSFPELRQKAKFLAIPSTSGTATEVTAFSVITDYQPRASSILWLTSTSPPTWPWWIRSWLRPCPRP